MPYKSTNELPNQVKEPLKNVPHAQDIFMKAYNSALDQYDGDESRSARVAWAAVKNDYRKGDDGKWHAKE